MFVNELKTIVLIVIILKIKYINSLSVEFNIKSNKHIYFNKRGKEIMITGILNENIFDYFVNSRDSFKKVFKTGAFQNIFGSCILEGKNDFCPQNRIREMAYVLALNIPSIRGLHQANSLFI